MSGKAKMHKVGSIIVDHVRVDSLKKVTLAS